MHTSCGMTECFTGEVQITKNNRRILVQGSTYQCDGPCKKKMNVEGVWSDVEGDKKQKQKFLTRISNKKKNECACEENGRDMDANETMAEAEEEDPCVQAATMEMQAEDQSPQKDEDERDQSEESVAQRQLLTTQTDKYAAVSITINSALLLHGNDEHAPSVSVPRISNGYVSRNYTMSPSLIGIAGQARMGKDTLGASFLRALPNLCRRSFASAAKHLLAKTFSVELDFIEMWKVRPDTPPGFDVPMRQALQTIGDGLRTIRASVWVDTAMAEGAHGVFTDVRYANEARTLRSRGGVVIIVGRTEALSDDPNPSESSLRPLIAWFLANTEAPCVRVADLIDAPNETRQFDWFVRNDGNLTDLDDAVRTILEHQPKMSVRLWAV